MATSNTLRVVDVDSDTLEVRVVTEDVSVAMISFVINGDATCYLDADDTKDLIDYLALAMPTLLGGESVE